eukprot:12035351-Alexandrium_andersonii.AAC.1
MGPHLREQWAAQQAGRHHALDRARQAQHQGGQDMDGHRSGAPRADCQPGLLPGGVAAREA